MTAYQQPHYEHKRGLSGSRSLRLFPAAGAFGYAHGQGSVGVRGFYEKGEGVHGETTSAGGETIHGETDSAAAAVAGYNHNGPAIYGVCWGAGEATLCSR